MGGANAVGRASSPARGTLQLAGRLLQQMWLQQCVARGPFTSDCYRMRMHCWLHNRLSINLLVAISAGGTWLHSVCRHHGGLHRRDEHCSRRYERRGRSGSADSTGSLSRGLCGPICHRVRGVFQRAIDAVNRTCCSVHLLIPHQPLLTSGLDRHRGDSDRLRSRGGGGGSGRAQLDLHTPTVRQ